MNGKYSKFGEFIESIRKEKGISYISIAKYLGVSKSYFSLVIHGEREVPVEWKNKIIDFFSLDANKIKELETAIDNSNSIKKISIDEIRYCFNNLIEYICENDEEKEMLKKRNEEFIESLIKYKKDQSK